MNIRYQAALICVKDMQVSRAFYEKVLGQKVEYDFGQDVVFHGGFAIHDADHFSRLLFHSPSSNIINQPGQVTHELGFECDDVDGLFFRLTEHGVRFLHPVQQQPWGQRVFRCYAPDNHIIEIGEPMSEVIKRYLKAGLSAEEIVKKTSMPLAEIKKVKAEC